MDPNLNKRWTALGLLYIIFWIVISAALGIYGWSTLFWITAGAGALPLLGLAFVVLLNTLSGGSSGQITYGRKTASQLNSKQAKELVRYWLLQEHGKRIDTTLEDGPAVIDNAASSSDSTRLYRIECKPVMRNEKIGVVMDLEDPIAVDIEDSDSLEKAAQSIGNIRYINSGGVGNEFDQRFKKAIKDLSGSMMEPIVESRYEDGEKVGEKKIPARFVYGDQNQENPSGEDEN